MSCYCHPPRFLLFSHETLQLLEFLYFIYVVSGRPQGEIDIFFSILMILDERLKLAHCHPVFSLLMIDCGTAVWPTVERVSRQRLPPTRGCWRHRLPRLGNLIRHRDKWVRQPWYDGHIITFALAVRFNLFSMCVFFLSTGHEGEKTPVSCGTAEDLPDYLT